MGLEISGAGLAGSGATGGAGSCDGLEQAASTSRPTNAKGWLILTVVVNSGDTSSSRSIEADGRGSVLFQLRSRAQDASASLILRCALSALRMIF